MVEYLLTNLQLSFVEMAFVFGSVAKNKINPNDCDLMIVTKHHPSERQWRTLIDKMGEVKRTFLLEFGIPLNLLFYTMDEFREETELKKRIFNGMTIQIK